MTTKNIFPAEPLLLVDDEEAWLHGFSLRLRSEGINNLLLCNESGKVLELLERQAVSAVVLDLIMPPPTGEELLPEIVGRFPELPVVVLTGLDTAESAVRCLKLGAYDYCTKVSEPGRLLEAVRRAIDLGALRRENRALRRRVLDDTLQHPEHFAPIVTHNRAMHALFRYMEAIGPSPEPVLVTGETGTGKELFARALHRLSGRTGEFVAVNVAGLDDAMFADTLFGHARGAFTGADSHRPGLIERAGGGTLFLDEIGDLDQPSQIKLLRLLQEREYRPLGSDLVKRTDARLVFATHADLEEQLAKGAFRHDLYYRLRIHHLHVVPLRERPDDLALLVEHFLADAAHRLGKAKISYPPELLDLLGAYPFPGNVRELAGLVFDAVATHPGGVLSLESFKKSLYPKLQAGAPPFSADGEGEPSAFALLPSLPTLKEAGRLLVLEALRRAGNNQAVAAAMLGISRQALNWRLKQFDS